MSTIRFRAGRVQYDESSKIATADPIQGQVTIKPSDEDESFYSFEWAPKDNTPGVEPDELLILPGDVTLKPLAQCPTGRILELKFKSSGDRNLYWLQEINDNEDSPGELSKKDLAILEKFNSIFEIAEEEEQEEAKEESVHSPIASEKPLDPIYNLNNILTAENINEVLENIDEVTLKNLYSHLPPSFEHTKENLKSVLFSNHFKRSAENLSSALNNGGGFVVSRSLNYPYSGEGVNAYLAQARKQQKEEDEREREK